MNLENQRLVGHDHMHAGHLPSSGEEELDEVMDNMANGFDLQHLTPPTISINGDLKRPQKHPFTKSLSGTVCYIKVGFGAILVSIIGSSSGVVGDKYFFFQAFGNNVVHCTFVQYMHKTVVPLACISTIYSHIQVCFWLLYRESFIFFYFSPVI